VATRIVSRALSVLLASTAAAHAGVYIESIERNTKSEETGELHRFWAQDGNARVEAGKNVTLLKGESMVVIDTKQKTYMLLDRAAITQMAGQMKDMQAQMDAQLAGLPPEQRAMAERMMRGSIPGGGAAAPQIERVDTGESEQANGRACRLWNVKRNGELTQQQCVVPYSTLPGEENLREVVERMASLTEALQRSLPQAEASSEIAGGMNGYPVLTRYFERGKPTGRERRVTAWREESVAGDKFEIPRGFEQRKMPGAPD